MAKVLRGLRWGWRSVVVCEAVRHWVLAASTHFTYLVVVDAAAVVAEAYRRRMRAVVEADGIRHIAEVGIVEAEELHIHLHHIEAVEGCKSIRAVILHHEHHMKPTGILEEGIVVVVDIHCRIAVVEDIHLDCGSSALGNPT